MMSQKIDLTGEEIVQGNVTTMQQVYQIYYYPPEKTHTENRVDKIALYLYFKKDKEVKYARRSVYFASLPQLRVLIKNLIKSYFYWLDHRVKPDKPRSEYRKMMLSGLMDELMEMQIEEWRNHT